MLKRAGAIALALGVVLLSACGPKAPTPTVHESMTDVMSPQAQIIWDTTSRAFNDKGDGLEASKISETDWTALAKAGQLLRDRAQVLAKARHVVAAAPGMAIMGEQAAGAPSTLGHAWDAASGKKVQAMIDTNPALFAQHARDLAQAGDTLVKAAGAKDIHALYDMSSGLDEVCDGCHVKFWGTDEPPPFPR